jgi:hypothetical protein
MQKLSNLHGHCENAYPGQVDGRNRLSSGIRIVSLISSCSGSLLLASGRGTSSPSHNGSLLLSRRPENTLRLWGNTYRSAWFRSKVPVLKMTSSVGGNTVSGSSILRGDLTANVWLMDNRTLQIVAAGSVFLIMHQNCTSPPTHTALLASPQFNFPNPETSVR